MVNYYTKLSLAFFVLILGSRSMAQNFNETPEFLKANSRWIFGYHAGIDFNSGGPVPLLTDINAFEGPSSISDPLTGDLMFYTNGETCTNAAGDVMPNGDSLLGNSNYSTLVYQSTVQKLSARQGTCIVQLPGEANKYYLFSLAGPSAALNVFPNYSLGSLFYSVVDMSLDNNLGDIVPSKKNIPLSHDTLAEAMIAVPGDNCDVWLLLQSLTRPEILAYHITAAGIDTIPVTSNIGIIMPNAPFLQVGSLSTLSVSPDRRKVAMKGGLFVPTIVANFNPSTGEISDVIQLAGSYHAGGDVCFSPDNSKLYVGDSPYGLGQFDIRVHDSALIAASLQSIGEKPIDLRLYGDTIYFTSGGSTGNVVASSYVDSMHRINSPNQSGLACNVEHNAFSLMPGTTVRSGLGNDVIFASDPDTVSAIALDTAICPRTELILVPAQPSEHVFWSDGSTNSTLSITQAGRYWALSSDGCHYRLDTFIVEAFDFPEPIITVNVLELGTVATYTSYQWLLNGETIPNATQAIYSVLENGDYQVIVTNTEGCTDTSEVYTVTNADGSAIDDIQRLAGTIAIYPNPASDIVHVNAAITLDITLLDLSGRALKHVQNATTISIQDFTEGVYLLKCYDEHGRLLKTEKVIKITGR